MQSATLQIAKSLPHPNSAKLLIDFMLSDQAVEILAKENRLSGRGDVKDLDPVFGEINAEKILSLSIEELQEK